MNPRSPLVYAAALSVLLFSSSVQVLSGKNIERFQLREPRKRTYSVEIPAQRPHKPDWIKATPENDPESPVFISSRLVVKLTDGTDLESVLAGGGLEVSRKLNDTTYIVQATDPVHALRQSERIGNLRSVTACAPIMRRPLALHSVPLSSIPNDPAFTNEWNLEERAVNGTMIATNLNARAAWSQTKGAGTVIAFADDGIELTHPDLLSQAEPSLHYNFGNNTTDGGAASNSDIHATAVAGLAVAEMNNGLGGVGVAPEAHFASWKIFNGSSIAANDEQLGDMYVYAATNVTVQNHSWGHNSSTLNEPSLPEKIGIETALTSGRQGKGTIMVRSIADRRTTLGNANDDGYPNNPGVIAVGGLLSSGRVASYSNPGACLLVSAPGGEFGSPTLFTTDRTGSVGYNTAASPAGDYSLSSGLGQAGTSFAAPQVAGIAALMVSANTNLTYRDVQQILILSSRQTDFSDNDITTNSAGFVVSHNTGFGMPDAGVAVALARVWPNRPSATAIEVQPNEGNSVTAPDDGLRVLIPGAPGNLQSLGTSPTSGIHPSNTATLPLVDVGFGTNISLNLSGKAALIQRGGGATFAAKVNNAAAAGAQLAIIYNNTGTTNRLVMTGLEYTSIPAVFLSKADGDALSTYLSTNSASAQISVQSTNISFNVTNKLLCEHVEVSAEITCRRSDARLVLTSPSGTQSVLQAINNDTNTIGLVVWTYTSTHHFYESSAGTWTLSVVDEASGQQTILQTATLKIHGVAISDTDSDGLDDNWELANFSNLLANAKSDPDNDGFNNAREQILGTNPNVSNAPSITAQPTSRQAGKQQSTTFSVSAQGMGPLFYQWTFNGTNIDGATDSSLTLNNLQFSNAGSYSVAINNIAGTTQSETATLGLYDCTFNLSSNATVVTSPQQFVSVSLATSNDCPWTVTTSSPWITPVATNGVGSATVNLIIQANTGETRSGTVMIGGNVFSITQIGAYVPADVTRRTFTFTITSGSGAFATNGTFVVITSPNGSNFIVFSSSGSIVSTNGTYDYQQGVNGTLNLGFATLTLQFTSAGSGSFVASNEFSDSQTGTFRVLPSSADFNADFRTDLVFQRTNRTLAAWFMEGSQFKGSSMLRGGTALPAGWKVFGLDDMNGDGKTDLLIQHTTRKLAVWFMNGTNYLGALTLRNGIAMPVGWRAITTTHFSDDSRTDILMQHTNGSMAVWYFSKPHTNGGTTNYTGSLSIRGGTKAATGWKAVGAGDFNSDGRKDILMQHTTGKLAAWYMNGPTYLGSGQLRNGQSPGSGWRVAAVADLNSDGFDDVVFQNGVGTLAVWYMEGTSFVSSTLLRGGQKVPGWEAVGPR